MVFETIKHPDMLFPGTKEPGPAMATSHPGRKREYLPLGVAAN